MTFVTFVSHYTILEVDRDRVAFIHCVNPFLKLEHGGPLLIAFLKKMRENHLMILSPLRPKESSNVLSRGGLCYYRYQVEKLPLVKEVVSREAVTRGERVAGFLHSENPPRFS